MRKAGVLGSRLSTQSELSTSERYATSSSVYAPPIFCSPFLFSSARHELKFYLDKVDFI